MFPARRAIVEVRGCFWHQHDGCVHASLPRTRREWWKAKLDANVIRDARNAAALTDGGWRSLVVWECEIEDVEAIGALLRRFLSPLSASSRESRQHRRVMVRHEQDDLPTGEV